jgi:4-hydroxy 2-oxovalerate aldolase
MTSEASGGGPAHDAPVTLLDCTLRDGGYYNDWDYSPKLVDRYLAAMAAARVPIVEIGFRTLDADRYLGPTAHSTDRYLSSLDLPGGIEYCVMLNAKEVVAGGDAAAAIDRVFTSASASPVGLVRFATNFGELHALSPAVDRLHQLGYDVGVNLMQIASRTPDEIAAFGKLATEWGVRVAYFADSFGGMQPAQITDVVSALRAEFDGPVGCHTHDNMSLAFANTLAAIDAGATYADATLLGMGRGPGNARTEYVAIELARRGLSEVDAIPLVSIVANEFTELHHEFGWGTSVYYFLSAAHGIHPTYIQEMTKDGRYSVDELVSAVDQLGQVGGGSFSRERLESAATELGIEGADGTWDATGWCAGRTVLIVGPGPTGVERRADIEAYIRAAQPLVVALNAIPPVDPELVDAYAICHPVRALIDADDIRALERPVFMPATVQERVFPDGSPEHLRDYGMKVRSGALEARATSCDLPRIAAFPYALALTTIGGAHAVHLTGFDGFEPTNPRQHEMETVLSLYDELDGRPPLTALTRTSYSIEQSSIYAV